MLKNVSPLSLVIALSFLFAPSAHAEKATAKNSVRTKGNGLTVPEVKNAYYRISPMEGGDPDSFLQFKNGVRKDGDTEYKVEQIALGDLNHDGTTDAAAIWWYNGGGSGYFTYVTAFVNKNGRLMAVDNKVLGDRVGVRGLRIKNGVIIADVISHAEKDGAGFPSIKRTAKYHLKNSKMIGPESMY